MAVAPLGEKGAGGSASFLVRANDEVRYWCKALNNPQGSRVPVNEQIVGRLGQAIGVEVCEPMLVEVPADLAGYEYHPGHHLEEGWVHGSRAISGVTEARSLGHHADDENARRHAGFLALHDWLSGGDAQWLVAGDEDNAYYSHDHGHYFAPHGGPNWTAESLAQDAGLATPGFPLAPDQALDASELSRLADALEVLTAEEINSELAKLPSTWPVSDEELDAVAHFADNRRAGVAERLRSRAQEENG